MGIWAPLRLRSESHEDLVLSTGWGTFKLGFGLICFGLTLGVMRYVTAPLSNPAISQDFLITQILPKTLLILAPVLFFMGLLVMGYRKELQLSRVRRRFTVVKRFWGIPFDRRILNLSEISEWQIQNVRPKRFQPQLHDRQKPVGYWKLLLARKNGELWSIDEAPAEAEIRSLQQLIQRFAVDGAFESKP